VFKPFVTALALGALACKPDPMQETGEPEPLEPFDEAVAQRLDDELLAIVDELGPPGALAAVQLPGVERWTGAAGSVDLEGGSLQADAFSKAGSVTKTLTAALLLSLEEAGDLDLDDPLSMHWLGLARGDDITLRQLLQHSSGVPEYFGLLEADGTTDQVWTLDELVALVADEPLDFEPGSSWSYSNTNYLLAALAAEAVTGEPWQQLQTERLLVPLGLDEALVLPAGDDGWGQSIGGYLLMSGDEPYELHGQTDMLTVVHDSSLGPAGSLVAQAAGLAAWGSALWGEGTVLGADAAAAMVGDAMEVSSTLDYGLGTVIRQDDHGEQLFHNGGVYGYVAWLGYRPSDGATLAFLSNAWLVEDGTLSSSWSTEAADRLWAAFYGSG